MRTSLLYLLCFPAHIMSSASEGGGGTGSLRGVTSEVPGGSTCGSIGGSANPSRRNSRRTGWGAVKVPTKMGRKVVGLIMRAPPSKKIAEGVMTNTSSMGEASVYHALVVIFLEFFAWGLLTRYVFFFSNLLKKTQPIPNLEI